MIVDEFDVITDFISQLTKAGFYFDSEPTLQDGYMEFLAFGDGSMLNFSYKASEQCVYIEYQRY